MSNISNSAPESPIAKLSPPHEVFNKDVGTWDVTIEIHAGPGKPPMVSEGVARNRIACGGLWLISDFINESTGFEGHGIYGYDVAKGRYVGTWVDPMRTFLAVAEGSYDPAAKTMTFWFEADAPQGQRLRWREVTVTQDADTQIWHQFMSGPEGKEFELMTGTYRRRSE